MIPPWMIITALMIAFILFLVGCTQFDTRSLDRDDWRVIVVATATECRVDIGQEKYITMEDDSLEFEQPTGVGQ